MRKERYHYYILFSVIEIIKGLDLSPDSKILDVGCGEGRLVNSIHDNLGLKDIWGFDISDFAIDLAKKNFSLISERYFKYNAYEPKLPDYMPESYDLVTSVEVIEHMHNPRPYLKNLCNWLKSNGYLIITTPYHGYLKNMLIWIAGKADTHFNSKDEGGHVKFFSRKTLQRLLEEEGFKVIKFKGVGRSPYIWKSMIFVAKKKE